MKRGFKNISWSEYALVFMLFIALLAPFIAGNEAYHLIPYSENQMDLNNANAVSPFGQQEVKNNFYHHWLGTDELGRDVLTQLIYGSRTAFFVGVISMFFAAFIGLFIGGLAAYYGDHSIKMSKLRITVSSLLILTYFIFIIALIPWDISTISLLEKIIHLFIYSFVFVLLFIVLNKWLKKKEKHGALTFLPVDLTLSRFIEIMDALPLFFLVIAFSALFTPNLFWLSFIIGVNAWPKVAKYFRAEVLKLKKTDFIESAQSLGFSNVRILLKHILPNAISPVLVSLCFGFASAILIESSLSFLGLGISSEHASWGQLLAEARSNYQAWWLSIFPGLCIFITVYSLNKLADRWKG